MQQSSQVVVNCTSLLIVFFCVIFLKYILFLSAVIVSEMQFGAMPENETIDAGFILRRLQAEYCAKGKKLRMCFLTLKKL